MVLGEHWQNIVFACDHVSLSPSLPQKQKKNTQNKHNTNRKRNNETKLLPLPVG